jgi:hypothetical protein
VSNYVGRGELVWGTPGASCKHFEFKRLGWGWSSWKMHLRFTLRVLWFRGRWSKVRNVNGREDRSLESIDERQEPRSFYVRANSSAVQNTAANSEKRGTGKDRFPQGQHGGTSSVPERTEDASPESPPVALQIVETGRSAGPRKGLRSTPRRYPPQNEALTHHRSWREVVAPASEP